MGRLRRRPELMVWTYGSHVGRNSPSILQGVDSVYARNGKDGSEVPHNSQNFLLGLVLQRSEVFDHETQEVQGFLNADTEFVIKDLELDLHTCDIWIGETLISRPLPMALRKSCRVTRFSLTSEYHPLRSAEYVGNTRKPEKNAFSCITVDVV
jgi:hypothetical protein